MAAEGSRTTPASGGSEEEDVGPSSPSMAKSGIRAESVDPASPLSGRARRRIDAFSSADFPNKTKSERKEERGRQIRKETENTVINS